MISKILRMAEKLGLDKDELMQMTVVEAMLKIEETKSMWNKYREDVW